jgi:outer membrane protein TolC
MSEFIRQSESHLLEITRTYWALYAARVTYLQKARLVDETGNITDELRARQQVDAQKSQLFRAQSALASRRSDLVRVEAAVRNAQDRLRALTSDPELLNAPDAELIPADRLILTASPFDGQQAAYTALRNRPEINQAFLQLKAATIRENMSRNELMPELNLVLQGSLGGLTDSDVAGAYGKQYNQGGPGYGAGLVFSFPLENNIARAHLERRRLETRQQISQIKTTIDTVLLEVKVSAREVGTAYRETQAKYEAVRAFTEDLETLKARRSLQEMRDEAQVSIYLDTVLDAQDRRSVAEEEFIRSAADYQIAIVNLERAKGNLLSYSDVGVVRSRDEKGLPHLHLEKGARDGKAAK